MPTKLRLLPFRYFFIRWPQPYDISINVKLDLSSIGLGKSYPIVVSHKRDYPIEAIEIPSESYFTSNLEVARSRLNESDLLTPKQTNFSPQYFKDHDAIWVELLPSALANSIVQNGKEYLFTENWIALIMVSLAGSLWAALAKKS